MSIEEKLAWLLAIIACPFVVLLILDGGGGRMTATDAKPTQVKSSGTCHVESSIIDTYEYNRWEYELSCGHTIIWEDSEPPNYCPGCGRRIEQ